MKKDKKGISTAGLVALQIVGALVVGVALILLAHFIPIWLA